jgi:predicted metallopeptidase
MSAEDVKSVAEEPTEKYTHDANLQRAVDDVIDGHEDFSKLVKGADLKVVALFAKGRAPRDRQEAASCHKVSNAIRTVRDIDFYITFWREPWDQMTTQDRHKLIVHELKHIGISDKGQPKITGHSGDFCEIPEHDKESAELAKRIPLSPSLRKFDRQGTL